MARVHTVKSARKSKKTRTCTKCYQPVEAGQGYYHWTNRTSNYGRGFTRVRHTGCGYPDPWETTANNRTATLLLAGHNATQVDEFDFEGLADAARSAAEEVRSVAEEYRESAQNIEDGFGHRTYQCDELEERADEIEASAEALESAADNIEPYEPDEELDQDEQDEARQVAWDEAFGDVENAASEIPS